MSSFRYKRLDVFDNLELLESADEKDWFPFHFHDSFCISLITNGTERLIAQDNDYLATPGNISITQVNEVHKNSALAGFSYSYQTIYVNPELLASFNEGRPVAALQRVIHDPVLTGLFTRLFAAPGQALAAGEQLLAHLAHYAVPGGTDALPCLQFSAIDELIEKNIHERISTGWLARQFYMSTFHFIRLFKKEKGVSPQTYVMIKKLQHAKEMLAGNMPVKEVALENGFCHASHFTQSFRRYFGVSPAGYAGS